MKYVFNILLFLCAAVLARAQSGTVERKIVIQKGLFYYATIDPEQQMGTLHTGSASAALKKEKELALPAGRNYNDPINPFCWDILKGNCYAVNSLMHPMNDQNESLKRFPLASLQPWSEKLTIRDMLNISVDNNTFTLNIPYTFVTRKSKFLIDFYFDAIALNDSVFCMAVTNNEELSYWIFNGKSWDHAEMKDFPVTGYFSLFSNKQNVYMILNNGKVYSMTTRSIVPLPEKSMNISLSEGFLIVNKDDDTIKFLKYDQLDKAQPLNELIKKKALAIF